MANGGQGIGAAAQPASRRALLAIGLSIVRGLVLWIGELVIACVPLAAHEIVADFSGEVEPPAGFDPIPEICILAVVISGLSVVSLARFGSGERVFRHTPFSFIMLLLSVFSLMSGAVMYGLAVMRLDHGQTGLAYWATTTALLSSFLIALEKAIREA
jgi:hypothetical protein